ncbi:MAG: methyltransferase domain-containing protein [Dehalococcoidia bacterium]|nr:methyltransferase domain-containing protein [Dehalococcoidia bacterium]
MHKWDAHDYQKSSEAQLKLGRELISKLALNGSESVLDIGCGDGKVTAEIAARLPHGSVTGIDSSQEMIGLACRTFPRHEFPNLRFIHKDACQLDFHHEYEIAFSNAVLHWVRDHRSVLKGIYMGLKTQGRLLLQMGGRGNVADMTRVVLDITTRPDWSPYFKGFTPPYSFFGTEEYNQWLPEAGFRPLRIELIARDMAQHGKEGLTGWFRTTWHPFIHRVPRAMQQDFIDVVADEYLRRYPPDDSNIVHIAAVRLEVEAVKDNV